MKKLLIPIIAGALTFSCATQKNISNLNIQKENSLETRIANSKNDSILCEGLNDGRVYYNKSKKEIYFLNSSYEKLNFDLEEFDYFFKLPESTARELISSERFTIYSSDINDYFDSKRKQYQREFGKNKEFDTEKAMSCLIQNSKETIEKLREEYKNDHTQNGKLDIFGKIIEEQSKKVKSNKLNNDCMCKLGDTIYVPIKYFLKDYPTEYHRKTYAGSFGRFRADTSFLGYSSRIAKIGKDSTSLIHNKTHYRVPRFRNKPINNKEVKMIAGYSPVKINEVKGLRKLRFKITGELNKTKRTFDKVSATLPECSSEFLEFK